MNFFQKIGLATIDEETEVPTKKTVAPIVKTQTVNAPMNVAVNSEDTAIYSKIIDDALNKRDQPGPDFLEFYKTLKAIEGQPLPEQQKYIMAFSGLQVMGLTKDKIVSTSKVYLDEIDAQKTEFQKSMEQFKSEEIEKKTAKVEALSQENIQLQQKIQDNMGVIATTNTEIFQNTQKLNTKVTYFNAAIEKETVAINAIITNIKTYLV